MPSLLIVGAGPGVSAGVARRFAREGYAIGLLARDAERLEVLAAPLREDGAQVLTVPADAGSDASLTAGLERAIGELGPPSAVVYNAVSWPPGDPLELSAAALLDSLAVNAAGPLVTAQTCVPHMGAGTSLLITGGGIVFAPSSQAASLSIGKTATRVVSELLAQTLAPRGIHVASVVIAGMVAPGGRLDPDLIAEQYWRLHVQPADAWERETVWR